MLVENKSQFKQLLGLVRGNDFAHAGEAEAIDLVFHHLPKNADQLLLDVGCGLGETAHYIQSHGFGKVIGIDVDPETIEYAKSHFPDVEFHHCNVLDVDTVISDYPDIIYMFNVLYSIKDQLAALTALKNIAKDSTTLALFIYTDLSNYKQSEPKAFQLENPVNINEIEPMLKEAGWTIEKHIYLNQKYHQWYDNFVNNIIKMREALIQKSSEETYEHLVKKYQHLLDKTKNQTLGGSLIYAKPLL